jgi:hypothetical protein
MSRALRVPHETRSLVVRFPLAVGMEYRDDVGRVLDERAGSRFAARQRGGRFDLSGDILDGDQQRRCVAVVVGKRSRREAAVEPHAVASNEPRIKQHSRGIPRREPKQLLGNAVLVFGMDERHRYDVFQPFDTEQRGHRGVGERSSIGSGPDHRLRSWRMIENCLEHP